MFSNYHERLFLGAWHSTEDPNAGDDHIKIPEAYWWFSLSRNKKNKMETIQRQKLWISDTIKDKQINHLSKSQVCAAHRLRVICRNFPRKFTKLSMETPYLCPSEGHKHGRRDVRENIWNLILLLIATTFG